jgi:glycine/D-amino acid oxidase-like deaminating enzyme
MNGNGVRRVVCADGQRLDTDAVVLSAGAWTAPLAAQLGFACQFREETRRVRA